MTGSSWYSGEWQGHALCALGNLSEEETRAYLETGDYVLEQKLDGIRAVVYRDDNYVQIVTRGGVNLADKFPRICDTIRSTPVTAAGKEMILDGELIAPSAKFADVTRAIQSNNPTAQGIHFFAFDCLQSYAGVHYRESYLERHDRLRALANNSHLVYVTNHTESLMANDPMALYNWTKDTGSEGVVLKHIGAPYTPGRSKYWLRSKFKASISARVLDITGQRTVSCGLWVEDQQNWVVICNLLVPDDDLILLANADLTTVVEIQAFGCSDAGKLRHPSYLGLRFDQDHTACASEQLDTLRKF